MRQVSACGGALVCALGLAACSSGAPTKRETGALGGAALGAGIVRSSVMRRGIRQQAQRSAVPSAGRGAVVGDQLQATDQSSMPAIKRSDAIEDHRGAQAEEPRNPRDQSRRGRQPSRRALRVQQVDPDERRAHESARHRRCARRTASPQPSGLRRGPHRFDRRRGLQPTSPNGAPRRSRARSRQKG